MNKRIKELEKEASEYVQHGFVTQEVHFDREKFATLIIQECEKALNPMLRDMISRGKAYELIKQHFGLTKTRSDEEIIAEVSKLIADETSTNEE